MGTIVEEILYLGTKEEDKHITLLIYCYVLCVCMYMDTSALIHVHTHMCGPKANSRSYSSGYHSFCYLETGSPTGTWNLVIQSGWLASELQGPSSISYSSHVTNKHHHTWPFCVTAKARTQVLGLARQAFYQVISLLCPHLMLFIKKVILGKHDGKCLPPSS